MALPFDTATASPDATLAADAVLATLRNRRSIGKMTGEVPDSLLIRQIIEAATWAPNHHLTEPWRFFVLKGDARGELGEVMASIAAARESDPAAARQAAERAVTKPLRAPYVIAVGVEPSPDPSVPPIEEIAAGSAAVQNMLLAAHALGLAAIWRSGWIAFEPEVREYFGISPRGMMLGFVYVGYAAMQPPFRQRRSVDEVTEWRGIASG
ncbi:MAG TPA: nitroreductase [Thermomicrobiales bacterium]|nr:nitroreductase [Thermomicrobiales bacterium]